MYAEALEKLTSVNLVVESPADPSQPNYSYILVMQGLTIKGAFLV